jgi:hypothetical protein
VQEGSAGTGPSPAEVALGVLKSGFSEAQKLALAARTAAGRLFEAGALKAAYLRRNTLTYVGRTLRGDARTVIPDSMPAKAVWEVKDVGRVTYTRQIQAEVDLANQRGVPFHLIVRPGANISGTLVDAVTRSRGMISVYDPSTTLLSEWVK